MHRHGASCNVVSRCDIAAITHLKFGQWNAVTGDSRLNPLIDRLVHHAHVLAFTGESYRLRHALSQRESSTQAMGGGGFEELDPISP